MKNKEKILIIAEIAIFAAIGLVLDLLATFYSGYFPFGGSISMAMIPIIIISFRRGAIVGVLCGVIVGLVSMSYTPVYSIADTWYNVFLQIGMDYIFSYMLAGIVGIFKPLIKKMNHVFIITMATLVAGILKFGSHFLSGILYWPEFPDQPMLERCIYSLVYNGGYMIPTIIICCLINFVISFKFKKIFFISENN